MPTFSIIDSEREPEPDPGTADDATAAETPPTPPSEKSVPALSRAGQVIAPKTNERVAFIGSTQSGKTTLACHYLAQIKTTPTILVDTKGDGVLNRFARAHGFYEATTPVLPSEQHPRVIVHGPPEADFWDPLFWAVFRLRRSVTYIDELTHLTTNWNDPAGKGLRSLYSTGAGRGHGLWAATQRPSGVPTQAFSECDHVFAFRLSWPDDEDTMRRMLRMPDGRFESRSLPPYGFMYTTHGMNEPVLARAVIPIV